jgi:hypothetical protein
MTDAERYALIVAMRGEIAKRWGAWRETRKTYEKSNIIDQKRFDACARAALSIAEPIIRKDALLAAAEVAKGYADGQDKTVRALVISAALNKLSEAE